MPVQYDRAQEAVQRLAREGSWVSTPKLLYQATRCRMKLLVYRQATVLRIMCILRCRTMGIIFVVDLAVLLL